MRWSSGFKREERGIYIKFVVLYHEETAIVPL